MFENQREMFFHIWETRPHFSEVSGKYLGVEAKAHYFAHILGKGAYPGYKLNPDNIVLLTMEEHAQYDNGDLSKLREKEEWRWLFEKRELLKQKYNRTDFKSLR
jgi:hypothetical protein